MIGNYWRKLRSAADRRDIGLRGHSQRLHLGRIVILRSKVFVLWNTLMYDQKRGILLHETKQLRREEVKIIHSIPFINPCQTSGRNREEGQWSSQF